MWKNHEYSMDMLVQGNCAREAARSPILMFLDVSGSGSFCMFLLVSQVSL